MANVSGKQFSVGFRQARAYALDSRGIISPGSMGAASIPYEGIQIPSVKALDLTIPDIRRIVHVGDDRIGAQDILPRIEASSGVLRVGRNDHDLYALLTGTLVTTLAEKSGIGYATDQQGSEIDIGLLAWQQSLDYVTKVRHYRSYHFPITRVIPVPGSMNDTAAEFTFNLVPQVCTMPLWGLTYAAISQGYIEAEFQEWMSVGYPHVAAWLADGVETQFDFHASRQANSVAKVAVYKVLAAGTSASVCAGVITTASITPTVLPSVGDVIIAFYEYTP